MYHSQLDHPIDWSAVMDGVRGGTIPVNATNEIEASLFRLAIVDDALSIDEFKFLIEKGADITTVDKYGETPLHVAAGENRVDVVELLLSLGSSINKKNLTGQTPLHLAVFNNQYVSAELLITRGADVHAQDNNKRTPLHIAAITNNHEILPILLNWGADLFAKDKFGNTPRSCAHLYFCYTMEEVLLEQEENHHKTRHAQ